MADWNGFAWAIFFAIVVPAPTVIAFCDAALFNRHIWARTGRSKVAWLAALLVFQVLAAVSYVITARPELKAAEKELTATPV